MYVAVDAIDTIVFCIDSDDAARALIDGEGQQILEDALQNSSIRVNVQFVLYVVNELHTGCVDHRVESMDDGLDQGPEVDVSAHELRL